MVQLLPEPSQSCHDVLEAGRAIRPRPVTGGQCLTLSRGATNRRSAVFAGAGGTTTEVGSEVAVAEPSRLLAVTTERSVWPASPEASV